MIDEQRRPAWARRLRKLGEDLNYAFSSWRLPRLRRVVSSAAFMTFGLLLTTFADVVASAL